MSSDVSTSVAPHPEIAVSAPRVIYDEAIVRRFLFATLTWGIVGMTVGLVAALQLAHPLFNFDLPWLSFGRIRPLHTNAVIFAFAGNAIFCGVYYSMQRLLKTRPNDFLSGLHFWGWQLIIVAAAITLPLGFSQSKEYAELEWPIDIAITVVWVAFTANLFYCIATRRERHLYVSIWFYIATVITIAILHIFNNLVIPAGLFKSYSVYAGVQDAFMQWWYGHNAVGFLLTTPFLGLMYYYMPKAANRPVFSYKLSILHFWSLIFIYIWAGPHHLHYTALPEWACTLGMLFSVMLWMPSWGGMINGLLTLRGAWHKVSEDPILKFFVVAVTFYGMSTFEGPLMSIKTVNMLSHYTDWTIAHVHAGGLGWVGFLTFGMLYWLAPRVFQTGQIHSRSLMEAHVWLGTIGILLYIIPIYVAGITQGLMWSEFNDSGGLAYEFVETTAKLKTMYWGRVVGGGLYLSGALLCAYNIVKTWQARPSRYANTGTDAAPLSPEYRDNPIPKLPLEKSGAHVVGVAYKLEYFASTLWHRRWERLPVTFTIAVTVTVLVASAFEIVPTFAIKSNVKTISTVTPYTPLELLGRDIYIENGCNNCHSQMVRPLWAEKQRYGEYSKGGEFVYDHPFLWGSRRIGPDLHRVGNPNEKQKKSNLWHVGHLRDPRNPYAADSIMPGYPWLLDAEIDFNSLGAKISAMVTLGVPYSESEQQNAVEMARTQALLIAESVRNDDPEAKTLLEGLSEEQRAERGKPSWDGLETKQVIALTAYLQRLGADIAKTPEEVK